MKLAMLIGLAALGAAASAEAATLIVGNKQANSVSFIDLESGREVAEVRTGQNPHEVAISPDGATAAVVAYGGTTIDLFDVARAKLLGTCDLAPNRNPHGIVWTDDNRIFVTTEGSDTLTTLRPDCTGVDGIATGQEGSHMVVVDADRGRAYVSNLEARTVTAIDLAERRKLDDFTAAEEPEGIALTPDGEALWVANRAANTVFVLDPTSGEKRAEIKVGQMPIRLAISPDGRWAVTSNLVDGTLSVIDVAKRQLVRTIPVSGEEAAQQVTLIFSPDGSKLYVAETGRAQIAEVDFESGKVLRRLEAGEGSDGLGWSPVAVAAE